MANSVQTNCALGIFNTICANVNHIFKTCIRCLSRFIAEIDLLHNSSSNEQYLAEGTYFYILDLGNR